MRLGMHSQEDQVGPRAQSLDFSGSPHSIQLGHDQIEDRHVRIEGLSEGDRLLSVGGFTNDIEPFTLEEAFHDLADRGGVVGQEHPM
jgi:hypothetical protein